jgi:Flp pilus assembly protein TadB
VTARHEHALDGSDAALARLRLRVAAGARPDRLDGLPGEVRAVVTVADEVGAALLPTLDAAVEAHRQRRAAARQVHTATAPARTVAIGLVVLPLVAVPGLARLLGIDLVAFYGGGPGRVVGLVALLLWAAGAATIVALVRRAGQDTAPAGPAPRVLLAAVVAWLLVGPWLALVAAVLARLAARPPSAPVHPRLADATDLVAAGLSAGLAVPAALRQVAPHVPDLTADLHRLAWQAELGRLRPGVAGAAPSATCRRLAEVLADGLDTGGPLVPALRALAREVRAERGALAEAAALRLPARLIFPTALLLLPATVLAIGAPIVVTGLAGLDGV